MPPLPLSPATAGKPFDPHTYIQRLSLNIVMRLTYSKRFARDEVDVEGSDCTELLKVINAIVALGSTGGCCSYPFFVA